MGNPNGRSSHNGWQWREGVDSGGRDMVVQWGKKGERAATGVRKKRGVGGRVRSGRFE